MTSILFPSIISIPAYVIEDFESQNTARNLALNDAMKLANMQAGSYVKGLSRSSDQIITEDVVEMISANVLKIQGQHRNRSKLQRSIQPSRKLSKFFKI